MAVLCTANFLILVDTTIVNTAAPAIMADLGAGLDQIVWILNGYLLAFAALLIVFGRVGDVLGSRNVFAAGLGLFTAASLGCALAPGPWQLVAARVVQGVGAAALIPQALALITAIFPARRRGLALGLFTAVAGVASVGGPTLGGLLITRYGWPAVFLINVPVGLAALPLTFRLVPDLRAPNRPHRFDTVGVLLAVGGLVTLVYGLLERAAVPLAIAALALLLFTLWERRHPEPLLQPALFRHRNFTLAAAITAITSFALYGLLLVFVVETQTVLGMTPLMSGVTALPMTLALTALAPLSGRLADRVGGRLPLTAGLVL